MTVDEMIDEILRREGGFVDDPVDRGGATNFGITQKTLSHYLGYPVSREKVRTLDPDLAREIYETRYFKAPRIESLPKPLQPFLFDSAVNHGPRRAIKFLQKTTSEAGFGGEPVDGIVGPATRRAAERAHGEMGDWLLAALVEERRNFYRAIVAADASQERFITGWMNRAEEFWPDSLRGEEINRGFA